MRILQLLISFVLLILMGRFAYLQIFQHSRYQSKAKANRIREMSRPGPRGLIHDRFGRLLVDNRFTYTVSAIPWEVRRNPLMVALLSTYLAQNERQLQQTLREQSRGAFLPVRLATDLSFSTFARLQEHRLEQPVQPEFPLRIFWGKPGRPRIPMGKITPGLSGSWKGQRICWPSRCWWRMAGPGAELLPPSPERSFGNTGS